MVGCSSKKNEESKKEATKTEEKMKIEVSEKNPIIVDKKAKTVTVLSQLKNQEVTVLSQYLRPMQLQNSSIMV